MQKMRLDNLIISQKGYAVNNRAWRSVIFWTREKGRPVGALWGWCSVFEKGLAFDFHGDGDVHHIGVLRFARHY